MHPATCFVQNNYVVTIFHCKFAFIDLKSVHTLGNRRKLSGDLGNTMINAFDRAVHWIAVRLVGNVCYAGASLSQECLLCRGVA